MNEVDLPRVGVIGAGAMGERHARVYAQLAGCAFVGVFDPDQTRAALVAERHGGVAFADMDALFARVDAVSVVSPTSTHAEVGMRALDCGLHVLIEKPLAGTLSDAARLVERASALPGRVVAVGHIERFNPTIQELRKLIRDRPVSRVTMRRVSPFDRRYIDTDVVHDLMIHDIDLVMGLFGDRVTMMDARGAAVESDQIDQAVVDLSLRDGPKVTMIASRVANQKAREIELVIDGACVTVDLLEKTISIVHATGSSGAWQAAFHRVPPAEPLRVELRHFLRCVQGRETPLVDVATGYRAMEWAAEIMSLIHRSVDPMASIAMRRETVETLAAG